jgi:two-component system LytT family response regulator
MEEIKVYIVEDEEYSFKNLTSKLNDYCPDVNIIGHSKTVKKAIREINSKNPDLLLLDIDLPDGTSFDILESLTNRDVNIIFITAYNKYATRAFEFTAMHYLLKPVTNQQLQEALNRYRNSKSMKIFDDDHLQAVIRNFKFNDNKLMLITQKDYHIIDINDIVRCETHSECSVFTLKDKSEIRINRTLKKIEDLLEPTGMFIRVNVSDLINANYIRKIAKSPTAYVKMHDGNEFEISVRKRTEVINKLKAMAKQL